MASGLPPRIGGRLNAGLFKCRRPANLALAFETLDRRLYGVCTNWSVGHGGPEHRIRMKRFSNGHTVDVRIAGLGSFLL